MELVDLDVFLFRDESVDMDHGARKENTIMRTGYDLSSTQLL